MAKTLWMLPLQGAGPTETTQSQDQHLSASSVIYEAPTGWQNVATGKSLAHPCAAATAQQLTIKSNTNQVTRNDPNAPLKIAAPTTGEAPTFWGFVTLSPVHNFCGKSGAHCSDHGLADLGASNPVMSLCWRQERCLWRALSP